MREINLNGYIDEESWYGDEITPNGLSALLNEDGVDDVHITLNSYGGSCNAATQMYDMLKSYAGKVKITISGTAASAATVLCQAADVLTMTPGSLFMIHDPYTVAFGNEQDMLDTINVLKACKESIINVYKTRSKTDRDIIAEMMAKTTWMDATEAVNNGFIDAIEDYSKVGTTNAAEERKVNRDNAEAGVKAWFERKTCTVKNKVQPLSDKSEAPVNEPEEATAEPEEERVSVANTTRRLEFLRY